MIPHEPTDTSLLHDMECARITFKKDSIILGPDEPADYIYRVVSGLAVVYTTNRDDKNTQIIYGKDELFPLIAIVDKVRKGLYYAALSDCVVDQYRLTPFVERLQSDAPFAYETLKEIITQFMLFKARVDNLEYQYASQRLAYKILLLSRQFGKHTKDGLRLPPLTNQDIANTINLTRESVNRELAKFVKAGLITFENNRITILDELGLRKQIARQPKDFYLDNI